MSWQKIYQTQLSKDHVKVQNWLLDGDFSDSISHNQYGKVAKVSPATASRYLAQVLEMGYRVYLLRVELSIFTYQSCFMMCNK